MQYYFREITEAKELLTWLKLRYTVYSRCEGASFLKENKRKVDVDAYDQRSRHYGVFVEEADQQVMIGGLRVIQNKPNLASVHLLRQLDLLPEERIDTKKALPVAAYFEEEGNDVKDLIDERSIATEGSRLVLKEDYRSLSLAKFIISNAIVVHLALKETWTAFVSCTSLHARMYRSFNFKELDLPTKMYGEAEVNALYLRKEFLDESQIIRLNRMTNRFVETGFTTLEVVAKRKLAKTA